MLDKIRGIECSLYNGKVEDLLLFISNKPCEFYVQWCMKIDNTRPIFPKPSNNLRITSHELEILARESIWELVLHVYPSGLKNQIIETYDDFVNSPCICCFIFYDCSFLDIYVKDLNLLEQLYDLLLSIGAKNIALITDVSDKRVHLFP